MLTTGKSHWKLQECQAGETPQLVGYAYNAGLWDQAPTLPI